MGLRGIPETEVIFEDLEVPAAMAVVPTEMMVWFIPGRGMMATENGACVFLVGTVTVPADLVLVRQLPMKIILKELAEQRWQFKKPWMNMVR